MKKIFFTVLIALIVTGCEMFFSASDVSIEDWGPRKVNLSSLPNIQPDGGVGLWIRANGLESGDQITLDSKEIPSTLSGELITTSVKPDFFHAKKSINVQLSKSKSAKKIDVGIIEILK
jgi:hypothetical protein